MIEQMWDEWRRSGGEKFVPRVHENGFIQLDVGGANHLNVWGDPRIQRQRVMTPIHNHVFGFSSLVLKGRLINVMHVIASARIPRYKVYEAVGRQGYDTKLIDTQGRVNTEISEASHFHTGERYSMHAYDWHETCAPEPTVTLLTKYGRTFRHGAPRPEVLVPIGMEPDNDRHACDEHGLWRIILEHTKGIAI